MSFIEDLNGAFPPLNVDLDVSYLVELLHYFPMDKVNISAGSYDQYLYDLEKTVIDNYDVGNYQVSFFYAHLIFMSYVYYSIERAYKIWPNKVKDLYALVNSYSGSGKPNLDSHENTYSFSKIPEKEIFKVFYSIGLDVDYIQQIVGYIKDRDDYAHATGHGNMEVTVLESNIENIKKNINKINNLFCDNLKAIHVDFLLNNCMLSYTDVANNIADYIEEHGISIEDAKYLCNLGISNIRNENQQFKKNYRFCKRVQLAFMDYCIEVLGLEETEIPQLCRDDFYLFYRYKNQAEDYIENELHISSYRCGKDGVEFPLYECPKCEEEQLVFDQENGRFHCFACDEDFTTDDLSFCERCGSLMRTNDDWPICQNCIDDLNEE